MMRFEYTPRPARRTILVGLDASPSSWAALTWGAREAARTRRSLVIAHAGAQVLGRQLLTDAVARLVDDGVDVAVRSVQRDGHPSRLLLDLAEGADLTVVGHSRRVGGPVQLGSGMGSVTRQVLRHARRPVVVTTAEPADASTVVVGVSDSPAGRAALDFAIDEAARRGSDVLAVRSWGNHAWRLAGGAAPDVVRQQEESVLERLVQPARHARPTVTIRAHLDPAPVEIALQSAAYGAAMVVLGCRRTPDGLLAPPGPVTAWALDGLPAPVAVVPAPAGTGSAPGGDAERRRAVAAGVPGPIEAR